MKTFKRIAALLGIVLGAGGVWLAFAFGRVIWSYAFVGTLASLGLVLVVVAFCFGFRWGAEPTASPNDGRAGRPDDADVGDEPPLVRITKIYNYPAHAVRLFERVMREQISLGRSLHSLTKGYLIGTGISLRFEFAETPETADYRFTYYYGRRREQSDTAFQGWELASVLRMKCQWIPVGYFYLLKRELKPPPNEPVRTEKGVASAAGFSTFRP